MRTVKEMYTCLVHGSCIQAAVDQHNKLNKAHTTTINELQDTIADLQSEITRLNKEILFTQESYQVEIESLMRKLMYVKAKKGSSR
jgi:TolA-binding protein